MGYDAFMSYSHAADSQLAPKLQDGLQRMAKPWWRRRSLHVFRDTTGLTANPGLWSSIEAAMEDSEWFVFLASPEAAASPWVAREVAHWLEVRGPDRLLPVVTDGTWTWDAERNDFDWAACTAVPAALAGVFAEEPRHVDMSWARSEEQLDLRNGRFRDQVAEIAAPIHGMAKDDLEGVDIREHRRTLRWAWGAAAALLLLALASTFAGVTAVRNADEAAMQRIAAQRNAVEAQDQKQAADANAADADEQKRAAEESAVEAQSQKQAADTNAAEAQTQQQAAQASANEALTQQQAAQASATEAQTQKAAADANATDAQTQKTSAQAAAAEARKQQAAAQSSATEAQRQRTAAQSSEQLAQRNAAEAIQQRAAAQENAERADAEAVNARQSADRAVASQRQAEQALQSETQARAAETAARQQAELSAQQAREAQVQAENAAVAEATARDAESRARQSAETEALASASKAQASQDGSLSLLLAVEAARRGQAAPAGATVVGADGLRLAADVSTDSATGRRALFEAVTASQGGADAYRVDRYLAFPAGLVDPPSYVWKPVLSPDGRYLAAAELADPYRGVRGATSSRVFVWDLRAQKPTVTVLTGHTEQVAELAFAGGGRTLVSQDVPFDPAVPPTTRIWNVADGRELLSRPATASVSPTGGHIALQAFPVTLGQVEFVDGADGRALAVQPGFLSRDWLGNIRETQSMPYLEQPFSPDGRYALGESGGRAVLWDLSAGGAPTIPLSGPSALSSYAPRVSPDGTLVAAFEERAGGQTALSLYDPSTGQLLAAAPPIPGLLINVVWSPDGTRLATIDSNGTVLVLDLDGDADDITWVATQVPLGETSFTRDGRYFTVTVRVPNTLGGYATVVHDTETGANLGYFEGELLAASAGARPSFFLERVDGTLNVIDSATGRPSLSDDVGDALSAAAVSDSGRWLAVSNASGVRIWDLQGSARPVRAAGVTAQSFGLAFLPDDDRLVGVGIGGVPTVWDLGRVGAGDRIGTVAPDSSVLEDGVTALEPTDGRRSLRFRNLVTGATRPGPALAAGELVDYVLVGNEGTPLVANLTNGTAVVARPDASVVGRTTGPVATASRDGSRLAVRDGARSIAVVSSVDLSLVRSIPLSALDDDDIPSQPDSVALSPDGSLLAATNGTGATVVWDVASGQVVTLIPGRPVDAASFPLWGLGFSPDGARLVVKSPSNDVRMYAVSTNGEWTLLATQRLLAEYAGRVVFSPDGTLVAVDGLFLLDGRSLAPVATLLAGPGSVTRFSADGRSLVTIASDSLDGAAEGPREVTRWTVDANDLAVQACRMAGRNLTPDEGNRFLGTATPAATCPGLD